LFTWNKQLLCHEQLRATAHQLIEHCTKGMASRENGRTSPLAPASKKKLESLRELAFATVGDRDRGCRGQISYWMLGGWVMAVQFFCACPSFWRRVQLLLSQKAEPAE
jgi:hypothetical protein